jgi:hypothetical protein
MKRISKKRLFIVVVLWVVVLFGGYSFVDWGFSDHQFYYGDLNYWLLTDSEIRMLPIVGAKSKDVLYHTYYQDGFKPAGITVVYSTQSDSSEIIAALKPYFIKMGYLPAGLLQFKDDYIQYHDRGYCEEVRISIKPDDRGVNIVRIDYIFKPQC